MLKGVEKATILARKEGCCSDENWGHLCEYHRGYADGYDASTIDQFLAIQQETN